MRSFSTRHNGTYTMSTTLNQLLKSTDPPEVVDPIPLTEEVVPGKQLVAVCLLGIFNPMGPTLVAINLVAEEGKPSVAILYTSLNPFAQTRLLTARAPHDPESVQEVLKISYQVGEDLILGSWPTLVLPSTQDPDIQAALQSMLCGLLRAAPPGEPASEGLADLKSHRGDPWGRIPSFEDMMGRAKSRRHHPEDDEPLSEEQFADWIALMGNQQHTVSELRAILEAWSGAIQNFGPGLPHMPVQEMAAELKALGYPYFK